MSSGSIGQSSSMSSSPSCSLSASGQPSWSPTATARRRHSGQPPVPPSSGGSPPGHPSCRPEASDARVGGLGERLGLRALSWCGARARPSTCGAKTTNAAPRGAADVEASRELALRGAFRDRDACPMASGLCRGFRQLCFVLELILVDALLELSQSRFRLGGVDVS